MKSLLSIADIFLFLQRRQKTSIESLNREQGNLWVQLVIPQLILQADMLDVIVNPNWHCRHHPPGECRSV